MASALVLGACAGGTDVVPPAAGETTGADPEAVARAGAVQRGGALATERNCVSCHSRDGSTGVGPTWRGLAGSTERLVGGGEVVVDRAYLTRSIVDPGAEIVVGFDVVEMPAIDLDPGELDDLVAYIESLG